MSFFSSFARRAFKLARNPTAFAVASGSIVIWAVTGPVFHFNDTWQLTVNTGTTIITFLLGFLMNYAQGEGEAANQAQVDRIESLDTRLEEHVELLNRKLDLLMERAEVFPRPDSIPG